MELWDLFIEALRAGIRGKKVNWEQVPTEVWQELTDLAWRQHVLPLIVEAVYDCPAFNALPQEQQKEIKKAAIRISASQTVRTALLLQLYDGMAQAGLPCLVMKGAACRQTYPVPSLRPSSDEDLLVDPSIFEKCCHYFIQCGMTQQGNVTAHECGFCSRDGLYIELHQSPFPPDAYEMGDSNGYFAAAASRAMTVDVEGAGIRTLNGHDHLLYLLLHAFKHFIHSGFGIRQVCDIVLWAETYGGSVDWQRLFAQCERVHCRKFAVSVFQIGQACLDFHADRAGLPMALLEESTPYEKLLSDILCGGVYGGEELSRKHSGSVTLAQVRSARRGKRYSLLQTVFPPRKDLQETYSYLAEHPALLPAAWCQRLWKYGRELLRRSDSAAGDSVRLSQQRAALLKELQIIE